ncbi:MAG: FHA domain-containing protein [Dehalococcoidia bacterium]
MATAAIVWKEGDQTRVAELRENSPNFVGRAAGSMVMLDDRTISRQQAIIKCEDGAYMVENLSTTNPTQLNEKPISGLAKLQDQDVINVGAVRLVFNDLAASATISGPNCSHCKRENSASDKDCWYCGTSLVNAPTTIKERRIAACRVLAGEKKYDIFSGEALALKAGGEAEVGHPEKLPAGASATIEPAGGGIKLRVLSGEVRVGGQPASDGAALATGDEVSVDGGSYVVIAS